MPKTVLITGCASGIGLETALFFHEKGWNVVPTMRNPAERRTVLHEKGLDIIHLDVTDIRSIKGAINHTVKKYGAIDALVNNAGYMLEGIFEASTPEQVRRQFETNVLGLMDVCREIIPVFRGQKGGTIVNVSSIGGLMTLPMYSVYNSSKWAVEGFSEGLSYELRQFGIRVKLMEPGIIKTDFYSRSPVTTDHKKLGVYDAYMDGCRKKGEAFIRNGSHPRVAAKEIFRAATSKSWKLRYRKGAGARMFLLFRKIMPDPVFFFLVRLFSI